MENGFLEQFALPEVALEHMKRNGYSRNPNINTGQQGVDVMMAHDKGVAYRFFTHAEYDPVASRKLNYEKFNEQTLIEFVIDKDNKPCFRLKDLPEELINFEKIYIEVPTSDGKGVKDKETLGDCIGGLYKDSFERFKAGLTAPGLPLSKWGVMADAECATFAMAGVFSVEQLAAMPRSKVTSKYPPQFTEYYERAIQFVNGKIARQDVEKHADKILALESEKEAMAASMAKMQEQLAELMAAQKAGPVKSKPAKKGKPKPKPCKTEAVVNDDGVIEGDL